MSKLDKLFGSMEEDTRDNSTVKYSCLKQADNPAIRWFIYRIVSTLEGF